MIVFWLIAAALAAVALLIVLRPLIRRPKAQQLSRSEANLSIYKDQLRELDADLAAGTLSPDDHRRARLELEARLLEDVPAVEVEPAPARGGRAALAVGIAVPLLAVAVYFAAGTPRALGPQASEPSAAQVEAMVARYGDFVLYRPPLKASTVLLWVGPFAFLIVGFYLLARFLRRRHIPEPQLSDAERARAAKLLE